MADNEAKVRFALEGEQAIRAAIEGLRDSLAGLAEDAKKSADKSAGAAQDEARRRERTYRGLHQSLSLLEDRALGEHKRRLAEETREEERQLRARVRARRTALRQIAGAAYGIGSALVGTAQGIGQTFGAQDGRQLLQREIGISRSVALLAGQTGQDPRALRTRIGEVATRANLPQEQVAEGFRVAQARFASQADFFAENMEELARITAATGAEFSDVITTVGNLADAFPDLSSAERVQATQLIAGVGVAGKVDFGEFARAFGDIPGTFARATGAQGLEAVRQQAILANVMASGGLSDPESAQRVNAFLRSLNDVDVMQNVSEATTGRKLRRRGNARRGTLRFEGSPVTTTGNVGDPVDFEKLTAFLTSDVMRNPATRSRAFRERRTLEGFEILQAAYLNNPDLIRDVSNATPETGAAMVSAVEANLAASGVRRATSIPIQQLEAFNAAQGGLTGDYANTMLSITETLAEYNAKHAGLNEILGAVNSSLTSFLSVLASVNLALGGTAATTAGGAAAGAGLGAGSVGAAGVGGAAATVAGFALPAAVAGYGLSETLTGSDSPFANGLPGIQRRVEAMAARGDHEGIAALAGQITARLRGEGMEGPGGVVQRGMTALTGALSPVRVSITPESVRALAGEVSRESSGAGRRSDGGPARRSD